MFAEADTGEPLHLFPERDDRLKIVLLRDGHRFADYLDALMAEVQSLFENGVARGWVKLQPALEQRIKHVGVSELVPYEKIEQHAERGLLRLLEKPLVEIRGEML